MWKVSLTVTFDLNLIKYKSRLMIDTKEGSKSRPRAVWGQPRVYNKYYFCECDKRSVSHIVNSSNKHKLFSIRCHFSFTLTLTRPSFAHDNYQRNGKLFNTPILNIIFLQTLQEYNFEILWPEKEQNPSSALKKQMHCFTYFTNQIFQLFY